MFNLNVQLIKLFSCFSIALSIALSGLFNISIPSNYQIPITYQPTTILLALDQKHISLVKHVYKHINYTKMTQPRYMPSLTQNKTNTNVAKYEIVDWMLSQYSRSRIEPNLCIEKKNRS